MVYVNSKKFACESCIKGHRSSSCHHTDRPLFEIKKKGRPVSQCEKCRELRQSKKVHSKCTCNPKMDPASRGQMLASTTSKSRRYIPIVPALPNGLKDVLAASQVRSSLPPDARQRVDSLLNPCNCKSVWKCNCGQRTSSSSLPSSFTNADPDLNLPPADLSTLARVAATSCCGGQTPSPTSASLSTSIPPPSQERIGAAKIPLARITSPKHQVSRPPSPHSGYHKRVKPHHDHYRHLFHHHHCDHASSVLKLPPIQSVESTTVNSAVSSDNADPDGQPSRSMELNPPQIPEFGFMPPISTITSLAGSGCTCGVHCACPGCVVHRGADYAARDLRDCTDGQCSTCVDSSLGIALPTSTSPFSSLTASTSPSRSGSVTSTDVEYITKSSFLDRFFKQAAALPPPPPQRRFRNGTLLDPQDVSLFTSSGSGNVVKLPKLECCNGKCGCPDGRCGCGMLCNGSCADSHGNESADKGEDTAQMKTGAPNGVFDLEAGFDTDMDAEGEPDLDEDVDFILRLSPSSGNILKQKGKTIGGFVSAYSASTSGMREILTGGDSAQTSVSTPD